jgi:cytochrome c-type biogenesis protein CcmH/NrfF
MCICGCNQILLECNHVGCPDSDGMRNELMAAVSRGDSDSLVEQAFVQKYGPTVLAAPTTTGFDRTAWIMPFRRVVPDSLLVVFVVRAWKNRPCARARRRPASRAAAPNSNNSATRPARRPTYDHRHLPALVTAQPRCSMFSIPASLFLGPKKTRASYLRERKDAVYENLRDLNFEYKAGKVPEADYQSLKLPLQDEAATLLAEIARLEAKAAAPRKATMTRKARP